MTPRGGNGQPFARTHEMRVAPFKYCKLKLKLQELFIFGGEGGEIFFFFGGGGKVLEEL